jgi:hypothetical protein
LFQRERQRSDQAVIPTARPAITGEIYPQDSLVQFDLAISNKTVGDAGQPVQLFVSGWTSEIFLHHGCKWIDRGRDNPGGDLFIGRGSGFHLSQVDEVNLDRDRWRGGSEGGGDGWSKGRCKGQSIC